MLSQEAKGERNSVVNPLATQGAAWRAVFKWYMKWSMLHCHRYYLHISLRQTYLPDSYNQSAVTESKKYQVLGIDRYRDDVLMCCRIHLPEKILM